MLLLSKSLDARPILSIQQGSMVGVLGAPIVNPDKLEIVAFEVHGPRWVSQDAKLLTQDIREFNQQGVVIDSDEDIVEAKDLVKFEEVFKIYYQIIGKPVITESKKRLGKVEEYVINSDTYRVQKLHVAQPLFRSFSNSALKIDRSQIVNVSDRKITVKDASVKEPAPAPATA